MLIILEGPDGGGKTSFAARLQKRIEHQFSGDSITYKHSGPPRRHPLAEYEMPLLDYNPGQGKHLILDRWHWGERVYPQALNRETLFDAGMWLHLEQFMQSRGVLVVHITVPTSILKQRLLDRGETFLPIDKVDEVRARFIDVEGTSLAYKLRLELLDWDTIVEHQCRRAIAKANLVEVDAICLSKFVTYVGPSRPTLLFLGDVRGGHPAEHGLRPAFMPESLAHSGWFLYNELARIRTKLPTFGVANANDVDDVDELWSTLNKPCVIALGHEAMRSSPDPNAVEVYHPQYVRRFERRRGVGWYGETILDAVDHIWQLKSR